MYRNQRLGAAVLCAAIGILAGVAAAIGVFARGDGATALVTSARGGTYEIATNGVYAYNALRLVAEGVGWDVFTLIVAVPALLVASYFVARGGYSLSRLRAALNEDLNSIPDFAPAGGYDPAIDRLGTPPGAKVDR